MRGHLRSGAVRVDHERGVGRWAAAGHECLADVEDGVAPVTAVDGVALAERLPRAAAGGVELAQRLIGPRVEDATIGCNVQPGVERKVERSRAQGSQGPICLPHLGDIGTALRDQHLAVRQRRDRRIPAPGGHVRAEAPVVGRGVEQMRLDDPLELRILVSAGDEQRPVEQVGETSAEDVEPRIDGRRRVCPRDRVVDGGACEVLNGKRLGRGIADRVPSEHFAVRKQSHVNPDDGPVNHRPPLPDLPGIGHYGSGGCLRRPGRPYPRFAVEPRLGRGVVDNLVLSMMACRSVDVVREDRPPAHRAPRFR